MKKLMLILAALLCGACASNGWNYQAVEQDEVVDVMSGDSATGEQREMIAGFVNDSPEEELLAYPKPCSRKDCAGPAMAVQEESREAALLLSAARQLEQLSGQLLRESDGSLKTAGTLEVARKSVQELERRIDAALAETSAESEEVPYAEHLQLVRDRLEAARQVTTRLQDRLGGFPAVAGEESYRPERQAFTRIRRPVR